MTRASARLLLLVFLCSCAPLVETPVVHDQLTGAGRSVWRVTIGDREKPRYTGLLALRNSGSMLDVVLLDPTGIRLLAERVGGDGEIEVLSALPLVREKGLPSFLGRGLHRIFPATAENTVSPCFRDTLVKVCFGQDTEGRIVRSGNLGPFQLWSAEYFINKERGEEHLDAVVLDQGWFVPELRLERIGSDN